MKKNDWKKIGLIADKYNESESNLLSYQLDVALDWLTLNNKENPQYETLIFLLIVELFERNIYTNFHTVYEKYKLFFEIKKEEINKILDNKGFTNMDIDTESFINLYIDFFHKDEFAIIR